MKNPSTISGAGAFRAASTATLNSQVDATRSPTRARKSAIRFYWDRPSNSVQPFAFNLGRAGDE